MCEDCEETDINDISMIYQWYIIDISLMSVDDISYHLDLVHAAYHAAYRSIDSITQIWQEKIQTYEAAQAGFTLW